MRKSFLLGIFLLWLVLTGLATAFVAARGVDLRIVVAAAVLCVLPVLTTVPVAHGGLDWPRGRRAVLVCLPWILMSSVFVAASGGMASPALVFVVFPPLFALAFGWKKLAVETSIFSLLAVLLATIAAGRLATMPGAAELSEASQMYAMAGLGLLPFLVAGFVRKDHLEHETIPVRQPSLTEPGGPATPAEGPVDADSPAAGLDPIDAANDADGDTIVDVTREGRIRSVSGATPPGLRLRTGRVFIEGFPEAIRQPVATRLSSGGTFRQPLGDGRTIEITVDHHDLGMRIFLSEAAEGIEPASSSAADDAPVPATVQPDDVEAAVAERTAFFAGLGHDLKTPLNAILGFADIMRSELRGPMPEAYKDYSGLIHESGQDLLLMVEDILDYAKAEAGHAKLDAEPVDLVASADSVIAQLSGQAERANVKIKLLANGEVWAQADPRAVRQIWQNLLSNAIKYSDIGGLITLDARVGRHSVALSVRDQGAGMDEEDLERIARPFQQGRNARGRAGTGLGLAVVKAFADGMNGKVMIDTAPGQGTRVRVFLPKADPQDIASVDEAAE